MINRCGYNLDNLLKKSDKDSKYSKVEIFFKKLDEIFVQTQDKKELLRINYKILNIKDSRKADWINLRGRHELKTKEQVGKEFIKKIEGNDENLVQKAKEIAIEKELNEKKSKKEKKNKSNMFVNLDKLSDEEEYYSVNDEENDFEQIIDYNDLLNFSERVYEKWGDGVSIEDIKTKYNELNHSNKVKLIA